MAHNKLAEIKAQLAELDAAETDTALSMEAEPGVEAEVDGGVGLPAEDNLNDEPEELAELRKEAEKWREKATKRDADVSVAFQDRAEFRKKLEERDLVIDELKAKLDAINAQLEQKKSVILEDDLKVDEDFESEFPEVASYAKKIAATTASKAIERAAALEAKLEEINKQRSEQEKASALGGFRASVEAEHPDLEEFVSGKYAELIGVWANRPGKPKMIASIVQNPTAYDPSDLAYVLHQFKAENGITSRQKQAPAVKKPAPGDVAVSTGSKAKSPEPGVLKPFSNDELATVEAMLRANRRNPEKMAEITRRLDLTYGGR